MSSGKNDTNAFAARATDRSTNSSSNSRDHNLPTTVLSNRTVNEVAAALARVIRLGAAPAGPPLSARPGSES